MGIDKLTIPSGLEVYLSVASAHRVPDLVVRHANEQIWDAVIAGAGMTNALVSQYLSMLGERSYMPLILGLPISDSRTNGLSSLLSSTELPPGYPVAVGKMNDAQHLIDAAHYFLTGTFTFIDLIDTIGDTKQTLKAREVLDKLGVLYEGFDLESQTYTPHAGALQLRITDKVLGPATPALISFVSDSYVAQNNSLQSGMLQVGHCAGDNLALYGAKILARHDPGLAERIITYIEQGKKKYDEYKEIRKIGGSK